MSVDAAEGRGTGPGSTTVTRHPRRQSSAAAVMPNTPAPTTMIERDLIAKSGALVTGGFKTPQRRASAFAMVVSPAKLA
jgi:hypothetical protein